MNRLFASLYLDEDVSVVIGDLLHARQYDVLTTRDAGNPGAADAAQLAYATARGTVMVTHNRVDFERLAGECRVSGRRHPGIVIAVRPTEQEVASTAAGPARPVCRR